MRSKASTASGIGIGERFGKPDAAVAARLAALRADAGLSRNALRYMAWQRLGVRLTDSAIGDAERGRLPVSPVVLWTYEMLLGKEPRP